jgi:hypothetical protein
MMDDSKHTEDADVSRSEFTEAHAEETLRNLKKRDSDKETLQLKMISPQGKPNGYEGLREDEDSHREYKLN